MWYLENIAGVSLDDFDGFGTSQVVTCGADAYTRTFTISVECIHIVCHGDEILDKIISSYLHLLSPNEVLAVNQCRRSASILCCLLQLLPSPSYIIPLCLWFSSLCNFRSLSDSCALWALEKGLSFISFHDLLAFVQLSPHLKFCHTILVFQFCTCSN